MTRTLSLHYTADGMAFDVGGLLPTAWLADHTVLLPELQAMGLYLSQLETDDALELTSNTVLLRWQMLYGLLGNPDEAPSVAMFLPLPVSAPFRPKLSHTHSLADPQFSVSISWTDMQGNPLRSQISRIGGVVRLEGKEFLLSEAAWQLCEAVQIFVRQQQAEKTQTTNDRAWSRMRKLAVKAGAVMDDFLERTVILTPEKLRIKPRQAIVANMRVVEIMPLVEGVDDTRWLRVFDSFHQVQDHYDVPLASGGMTRIVVEPAVREVLAELKRYPARRVAGDRARAFLHNPYATVGEAAKKVIDETQFREDLIEADIYNYSFNHTIFRENNSVSSVEIILASEENTIGVPPIFLSLDSSKKLQAFIEEIAKKQASHFPCCVWDGYEITLRGDTEDQLTALRAALKEWNSSPQMEIPSVRAPRVTYKEVYDFTRYSPRVDGIGEFKPIYSPYIAKKHNDQAWIPDNIVFGIVPNDDFGANNHPVQHVSDEPGLPFTYEDLNKAQQEGASSININGLAQPMPVVEAQNLLNMQADIQKQILHSDKRPEPTGKHWKESEKHKNKRIGLLPKQNITTDDYREERKGQLAFLPTGKPALPTSLKPDAQLMPHQLEGVEWLQHLWRNTAEPVQARGCIYADDMGLGKTLQLLTFIAWYFETLGAERLPVLVVVPVALLENWQNEMERFFDRDFAKVLVLYDNELQKRRLRKADVDSQLRDEGITTFLTPDWRGKADIVLTTYEVLRDQEFSLAATRFSIMICDEAQKIKSPSALVTKAAKQQNARFKIACTGTPVENSLADLWCLFDFIQPLYLDTLNEFSRKYRRPIEANTEEEKQAVEELRTLIADQTLRRTKTQMRERYPDLIRLKNKIEDSKCSKLPITARQRELYGQAVELYKMKRDGNGEGTVDRKQAGTAVLSMLHHLRQVCADPRPPGFKPDLSIPLAKYASNSAKMAWLIDALAAIQKKQEKVLIFTEFRDIQAVLKHYIQQRFAIKPEIINGDTATASTRNRATRQQLINRFQTEPGFNVLILSPIAVGFGVNIQAANHVIHYTRCWNPAKENQATDRAYRIGQERDVTVYYPTVHAEDFITFEHKLDSLLTYKRRLADDMLNGADDMTLAELAGGIGLVNQSDSDELIDESMIERMDGATFEKFCLILWNRLGYRAEMNNRRPQGGVDIVATKNKEGVVMQCKSSSRSGAHLGREALSDVIMDYAEFAQDFPTIAFQKLAVTNQYFNEEVRKRATLHDVELVERPQLLELLEKYPVRLLELY